VNGRPDVRRWLAGAAAVVLLLAVVELVLLGVVIWWLGVAWTLALVLAKGMVGYLLVRREGGRGWRRFRTALDAGRPPGREGTDGLVGLVAGLLVLLAGFIGAVLGAVALVPPVRRWAGRVVEGFVERRLSPAVAGDVFGPRPVRVRRGRVRRQPPSPEPADTPANEQSGPPKAIEGEVLPPPA
jgi:UPF0716 protein FxsA